MKGLQLLALLGLTITAAAQSTYEAVYDSTNSTVTTQVTGTGGWIFQATNGITVTSVGCLNSIVSDLGTVLVGLWGGADQLLASNLITTSSMLVNQSRYESVEPVVLLPGQTFHLGIFSTSAPGGVMTFNVVNVSTNLPDLGGSASFASDIELVGIASGTGGFAFPTAYPSGTGAILLGPNFLFFRNGEVPEPSVLTLLGLGALALLARRRCALPC